VIRRICLGALTLTILAACSSGSGSPKRSELNDNPKVGHYQGFGLVPPQPRPSFTLADTDGKRFSFSQTAGRPTLLYFGYTRCPDVCPTTMADVAQALQAVPAKIRQARHRAGHRGVAAALRPGPAQAVRRPDRQPGPDRRRAGVRARPTRRRRRPITRR
jgi:hypothetical protein